MQIFLSRNDCCAKDICSTEKREIREKQTRQDNNNENGKKDSNKL